MANVARWVPRIIGLGGVGILALALSRLWEGEQARHWPTVEGRITRQETVSVQRFHSYTKAMAIRYSYQVEGKLYFNNRFSFGSVALPPQGDEVHISPADRYQKGQPITVYYHPGDPRRSVIGFDSVLPDALLSCFGGGLLGIALYEWRKLKRLPAAALTRGGAPSGS